MIGGERKRGFIYAVVAAATYGMIPLFALPLYGVGGMNPDSVLLLRYFFAILIVAFMLKVRGRSLRMKHGEFLPLLAMGVIMSLSSLSLFGSYRYMDGGIASTILFVYPVIVAVIMAVFYKEKITLPVALCIMLALGGIALLYIGDSGKTLGFRGTLLVLFSAFFYAIYIVCVNNSRLKRIPTLKLTLYMMLFGLPLFVVRILWGGTFTMPSHWYLWGNIVALALFPTAISFICTTKAVQYIGATPTAILGAIEPLAAIFIGVLVFDEKLTLRICIGLIMIILSVTMVVAGANINDTLIHFKKLFPKLKRRKQR